MRPTERFLRFSTMVVAVAGLVMLASGIVGAADPAVACQVAKTKAAGKREVCLANEKAKDVKGQTPDFAKCEDGFDEALDKADARAAEDGVSCRYVDNGDGTISDLNTLLMWEKKSDDGTLHDKDFTSSWANAMSEWLSELNGRTDSPSSQAGFAGYEDWRLATHVELQTILLEPFRCDTNPCVDPIFNTGCASSCTVLTCSCTAAAAASYYWSSTTFAFDTSFVWNVNFFNGDVFGDVKSVDRRVRAVRGGR